jgi:glycosyltransferase involved in cell wall biosynthesis
MAAELARHLQDELDAEQVFIERRRKCRSINWRERPDRIIEHWTKHLAFLQINARLPRYDIYHFLSERHARLLRYGRKPAVATIHDAAPLRTNGVYTEGTKRRFRQNIETLLQAQVIVANTLNAKRDIVELFGVARERVTVVYPGVNQDIYKPRDKSEMRRLLGLPVGAKIILNVGNENKNNNIPALIEVVARIRKELPETILLRVGPTSPHVDRAIERLNMHDAVIRTGPDEGPTTQYNYYFNAADIYLCMDHYTGYSIQGLSSMSSGCPVVSSKHGGFSEVADGAAALVDHANPEEVVRVVIELLGDDEERLRLVHRGLEHSRNFTWKKTAMSYLDIYEKMLGKDRLS